MSTAKLETIMSQEIAYEPTVKAAFHREAKAVLKKVASAMGLAPADYDLRSNKGGIAVSGEVTLHTDKLYVQVCQSFGGKEVMYRTCEGRKDYTGGPNNWARAGELLEGQAINRFQQMQNR